MNTSVRDFRPGFFKSSSFVELDAAEQAMLQQIKEMDTSQLVSYVTRNDFNQVVRLATYDEKFQKFCRTNEDMQAFWKRMASGYGCFIAQLSHCEPIIFLDQPKIDPFNYFCGNLYYTFSLIARHDAGYPFSPEEMLYLKEAVKYKSVHALQKDNIFIYEAIDTLEEPFKEEYYRKAIQNSRDTLPHYGSYGYFLLAEAYFRYAFWLKNSRPDLGQRFCDSFCQTLNLAKSILAKSEHSIWNASLGRGLSVSNSWQEEDPDRLRNILLQQFNSGSLQCLNAIKKGNTDPQGEKNRSADVDDGPTNASFRL